MSTGLHRLDPGAQRSVSEIVHALGLRSGPGPRVMGVMIASIDGRATVEGRSAGLGHPADRALLRALRAGADAILVGSRTLRVERYARLLDDDQRAARRAAGRPAHPLVVTVSRRLELPLEAPLLDEPGVRIVVATESQAAAPEIGAELSIQRFAAGSLTLAAVVERIAEQHGVRAVLCEGGPSLLRQLVAEQRLDDLLLTVSPLLAAGEAPSILEGRGLPQPAEMTLRDVHRADDHLFLHYATSA
jgi:riboflavin biosynthesis pyrimidine reductase